MGNFKESMKNGQLSLFDYKPPQQQLFDSYNEPTEVTNKPPWRLGSFEGRIEVYAIEDYFMLNGKRELDSSRVFILGKDVLESDNAPLTHQPLFFEQRRFGMCFVGSQKAKDYATTQTIAKALKKYDFLKEGVRWRHPYGDDELLERSRGQIRVKWTPKRDHVRVKGYLTIDEILEIESYLI